MDAWHWITFFIISFAHLVGGVTAFGSSLLAVAALVALDGTENLNTVVAVLAVCGLLQSGMIAWRSRHCIAWRSLGAILGFTWMGLPIGHVLSTSLSGTGVQMALGGLLVIGGLTPLLGTPTWRGTLWLRAPLLILSGVVHGCFASGGTVLIPYVRITIPQKDCFRATLSMVWVVLNLGLLGLALCRGSLPLEHPLFLLLTVCGVIAATRAGQVVAARVSEIWFSRIVSVAMVAAGLLHIVVSYKNG